MELNCSNGLDDIILYLLQEGSLTKKSELWFGFRTMYPGGYTAEVTTLSPKATEKDVYDFFNNCGNILHLEIIR